MALVKGFNRETLKPRSSFLSFVTRHIPILLGVIMAGALGAGVFVALKDSPMFAIRAIPLEWKSRLDDGRMEVEIARTIEARMGAEFATILGKRPWEVDLGRLTRSIQALPWITEARIQRVFPDRLVVSIVPKRPLAVIIPEKVGKKAARAQGLRPVSDTGELMPEWESDVIPDVPFLRGEEFAKEADLRGRAVDLIRALPKEGILARNNIAEISYSRAKSNSAGFSVLLLSPRTEIQLGTSDIETKLGRVAHVLNYLSTQGQRAPVIDSTSVKKVVVRAQHRP